MKLSAFHFLRSSLVLSLCILLALVPCIFTPADARAFGSLSENGTAAYMGIGTVPQKILHVSGSGPGTVPLFVRGSDSAGFIIERTPTNRWVLGVNESPTLGTGFVLSTIPTGTTSVPRLTITQDGNVGIHTTSPSYRLHVRDGSQAICGEQIGANNYGVLGKVDIGVYGHGGGDMGTGVYGYNTNGVAIKGVSDGGTGYLGSFPHKAGVVGSSVTGGLAGKFYGGVQISDNLSVGADSTEPLTQLTVVNDTATNGAKAVYGEVTHTGDAQAVYGLHDDSGNYGFLGDNTYGVYGYNSSGNRAALGSNNYAGYFWGNVRVDGSLATAYRAVSANYTIAAGDSFIAASANPGSIYVTLPSASGTEGRTYTIKKVDTNPSSHVYVYANGSESIDITNSFDLSSPMRYVTLISNGAGWYVIANN